MTQSVQQLIDALQGIDDKSQPVIALVLTGQDLFMQATNLSPEQSADVSRAVESAQKQLAKTLEEAAERIHDLMDEKLES